MKFVVRLLTGAGDLLAWAELFLSPQAGGTFASTIPTAFPIEADGVATAISIHWTDLDIARLVPLPASLPVASGQLMQFAWHQPVWSVAGEANVPKPTVTVRGPVVVTPDVGSLGTRAQ